MTNETKDRRLLELIHELAQRRQTIVISDDFPGMLTVTVGDRSHQHLGCPHGSLKELDVYLRNYLASCLEETTQQDSDNG